MTFIPEKKHCPTCNGTHPRYIEGCPNKKAHTMNKTLKAVYHDGVAYLVDEKSEIKIGDWYWNPSDTFYGAPHFEECKYEHEEKACLMEPRCLKVITQPTTGTLKGVPYYSEKNEFPNSLVEIQKRYIELLKSELDDVVGFAHIHGWKSKRYDEGVSMRKQMEFAEEAAKAKGEFTEEDMYMLSAKVVNDIASNIGNADWNFFTTPKMIADDFIQSLRPKKRIIGATVEMEECILNDQCKDEANPLKTCDCKPSTYIGEDGRNYLKVKLEYE